MYRSVLLIHILAGAAWIGGGFVIQVTETLARKTHGVESARRVMESFKWADSWLAVVAPILVVGTGVAMVIMSGAWRLSQAWIWASLALVVAYEVLAGTVGARVYKHSGPGAGDASTTDPKPYLRFGAGMLVFLTVAVALMVFKPI